MKNISYPFIGKKVYLACIASIIANGAMLYLGMIPLWFFVGSAELLMVIMAFRSTMKRSDSLTKFL
jgi:hypothetical protein